MTDDIVTRVRGMANSVIDKTDERFRWLTQAADEIERLRIQVAHYEAQLKNADVVIEELEADIDEWMRLAHKAIGLEL